VKGKQKWFRFFLGKKRQKWFRFFLGKKSKILQLKKNNNIIERKFPDFPSLCEIPGHFPFFFPGHFIPGHKTP